MKIRNVMITIPLVVALIGCVNQHSGSNGGNGGNGNGGCIPCGGNGNGAAVGLSHGAFFSNARGD